MMLQRRNQALEKQVMTLLAKSFSGMSVEIGYAARWDRTCIAIRWEGFGGLLPEERFHRLVSAIPDEFRTSQLAGLVWVELAPGETVDDVLKLPRSEDIAKREADIGRTLTHNGFFATLADRLGRSAKRKCPGDFTHTAAVLSDMGKPPERIRDAKLLFIRHGAFCDCQVVATVQPAMTKEHAATSPACSPTA